MDRNERLGDSLVGLERKIVTRGGGGETRAQFQSSKSGATGLAASGSFPTQPRMQLPTS